MAPSTCARGPTGPRPDTSRLFRGDGSRHRRGCRVDIPWGDAATRIFRGEKSSSSQSTLPPLGISTPTPRRRRDPPREDRGPTPSSALFRRPSIFVRSARSVALGSHAAPRGGAAIRPAKTVGPHHIVRSSSRSSTTLVRSPSRNIHVAPRGGAAIRPRDDASRRFEDDASRRFEDDASRRFEDDASRRFKCISKAFSSRPARRPPARRRPPRRRTCRAPAP